MARKWDLWGAKFQNSSCLLRSRGVMISRSFWHFLGIYLPYKPLDPRLVFPMEWPIQEHHHSEGIDGYIHNPNEEPTSSIVSVRMKHQQKKWYGVVSKLNQWCRNESYSRSQKICQHPDLPLNLSWQWRHKQALSGVEINKKLYNNLSLVLTQNTEDGKPWINIKWDQKVLHWPMSVDDLSPEIKGIVPIVSKKIRMSYAVKDN